MKTAATKQASPLLNGTTSSVSPRQNVVATAAPIQLQTKLTVNRPDDTYEQEADRVAEQVMRMQGTQLQRQCTCSDSSLDGECSECKKKKNGGNGALQRTASSPAYASTAPPIVSSVLNSPGSALPTSTRIFMESRFGRDFSHVRVHTDREAAESAAAVQARAYTVGNQIVFGRGETPTGDGHLLAHELTHVLQQTTMPATNRVLQRRGPMPVPPPVRPAPVRGPVRPTTETIPGRTGAPGSTYSEPIWVPDRFDNSFEAAMQRGNIRDYSERQRMAQERPVATLDSGGTAPHFITEHGTREYSWIGGGPAGGGSVTVRIRKFHVLDAISHRVANARDNSELMQVLIDFIPQAAARLTTGRAMPLPRVFTLPMDIPIFPPDLDPDGTIRLRRFLTEYQARQRGVTPDMRRQALSPELADVLLSERVERREGGCNVRPVPRRGGNTGHDNYATAVTGSPNDFQIDTPEGRSCVTDGVNAQRVTWEVKTLHSYLTDLGMARQFARGGATFHQIADRLEEQRARCVYATARCGYRYIWAVQYPEVAEFLNEIWGGLPPVYCRKADGSSCS